MSRGMDLIKLALVSASIALALTVVAAAHAEVKYPYVWHNCGGSKTVIPSEPTRIVSDSGGGPPVPVAGVDDVGAASFPPPGGGNGWKADGVPKWTNPAELNGVVLLPGVDDYKEIAALRPDLITVTCGVSSGEFAHLEAIAPTIQVGRNNNGHPGLTFGNYWSPALQLASLWPGAVAGMKDVIARILDRTTAWSEFVRGETVSVIDPQFGSHNMFLDGGFGGLSPNYVFVAAGLKLQASLAGISNGAFSSELLPELTGSHVLTLLEAPWTVAAFKQSYPLYTKVRAYKTGHFYFTTWWIGGDPIDPDVLVDQITEFEKEMFGVTGREATLAKPGTTAPNPSYDVAVVDVGPTDRRVCWKIADAHLAGDPNADVIENANGTKVLALGHGYHTTGCENVKLSVGTKLIDSPSKYHVALEHNTNVILAGTLGLQTPAFLGGGDKLYSQ